MKNPRLAVIALVIMIIFLLAGCAPQPKLGMTFEEWNRQCRMKNWTNATLVQAEGEWGVYYCDNVNVFHYFNKQLEIKIINQE
jgi:hypothetical protein